jgi:ubiquinone/menaquinone biosynthesis C-methylase UbiE
MPTRRLHYADQFRAIAPYYDEVMSVVPYRQWVRYLGKLLKRHSRQARRVLDVACGTGTVALLLAEEGYAVTGVDLSAEMIAVAQRKAAANGARGVSFQQADATSLTLPAQYDLAICLFDSLNYILTAHGLQRALAGIYAALAPGGAFIFDLNSEFALEKKLFSQENSWDVGAEVKHVWRAFYNKRSRIAHVDMEFYLPDGRTFREVHVERAHRHEDVLRWLSEVGFEVVATYDGYTMLPPGRRSERIFYVAQKPTGVSTSMA